MSSPQIENMYHISNYFFPEFVKVSKQVKKLLNLRHNPPSVSLYFWLNFVLFTL